ncbi:MAG: heparan-alpha-glucosaminide N-acetyltransferase domain-containing protein [Actinomycetota bacterium]
MAIAPTEVAPDLPSPSPTGRIVGIDLARAVAMIGMTIAHFVEAEGDGIGTSVKLFTDGRAMPLFVLLGGVGVTLLVERSESPDLDLLTRAAVLLPLGMVVQGQSLAIAVILQYYAVFFLLAVGLRRLSDAGLLVTAVLTTVVGGITFQTVGADRSSALGWEGFDQLPGVFWALTINGYYPVLPTIAVFGFGMWLGRRQLDDLTVIRNLVVVGLGLALVGYVGGRRLAEALDAGPWEDGTGFEASRLLDAAGHSQMPAWVIGSTGTSMVALGLCLLVTRRPAPLLTPFVVLGQMALTYYVAQAVIHDRWWPRTESTQAQEYAYSAALLIGFVAVAMLWRRHLGRGPLERLLRVGDLVQRRRRPSSPAERLSSARS